MGMFNLFRKNPEGVSHSIQTASTNHHHQNHLATPGFAVVDVETTGLNPHRDRIVEVAVISIDSTGHISDEWETLINPLAPVGATRIHGISKSDVKYAPRFADIAGELTAHLAGRVLVAHNARFDLKFLQSEYARAGWDMPDCPYLCTLDESTIHLPTLSRRRLADCCWALGINLDGAHSALGDARAAAGLLASYRNHGARRSATQYANLISTASTLIWPNIPLTNTKVVTRASVSQATFATQSTSLASLLDNLPISETLENDSPTAMTAYLELLAEIFEDGIVTQTEADSLESLTKVYSMTRQQVDVAHRNFLFALARKAVEDGKVTQDERSDLVSAAVSLGVPSITVTSILDEARIARAEELGERCRPLPEDWQYGEPLRIGDGVAFTGGSDLARARLEGRAQAAGLRVTNSVSGRTAVLVTDDVNPQTTKAIAAAQFNTRIVSPAIFAKLVTYVQPALTSSTSTHAKPTKASPSTVTATAPNKVRPGPEVREWARKHGFPVGTRGRLSHEIIDAYTRAHS